ncbi:hypothetical protein Tco_0128784 [Tanacetum coccineum]
MAEIAQKKHKEDGWLGFALVSPHTTSTLGFISPKKHKMEGVDNRRITLIVIRARANSAVVVSLMEFVLVFALHNSSPRPPEALQGQSNAIESLPPSHIPDADNDISMERLTYSAEERINTTSPRMPRIVKTLILSSSRVSILSSIGESDIQSYRLTFYLLAYLIKGLEI